MFDQFSNDHAYDHETCKICDIRVLYVRVDYVYLSACNIARMILDQHYSNCSCSASYATVPRATKPRGMLIHTNVHLHERRGGRNVISYER